MTIRELIEEQRRRLGSGNPVERLAAALLIPGVLATRLHQLRDNQIGQLLLDEVWARMSPLHPESVICLQALDRLRGSPEGKSCKRPACPRCGREMYFHCGVEEPDYWQCDLRGCGGPRGAPIAAGGTSRVSSSLKMSELGLELRVNGTEIDWVQLRPCGKLPTELELVVRDPVLGEFAVDREAFTFEVRQKGEGAQWRQMSMDEALEEIAAADMLLDIEGPPGAPKLEEHERLHRPDMRRGQRRRRTRVGEKGAHVIRAEEVLYSAGVPHILLPVQRDRFASNVFMVPGLLKAKIALCRGGFKPALPSHSVMVHIRSGRAIRLLEANGNATSDNTKAPA